MTNYDAEAAARFIADAHTNRAAFENLEGECAPPTVAEAYDAQEALCKLWEPLKGPVAGLKIATTTKVMQELMGIDHPCGGMIYGGTIQASPGTLTKSRFMNPVIECELAVRLGRDLPAKAEPYTDAEVRAAIGSVMAAFEIIEDRNAVYKESDARTLIADNAWNGGIIIGPETAVPAELDLNGIAGHVTKNGAGIGDGHTDNPIGALAWVANLAVERGRPMTAGMVVITGSVVPTFPVEPGDHVAFGLDRIGGVEFRCEA
jgi:2-keto-4-pentenoate hydratase